MRYSIMTFKDKIFGLKPEDVTIKQLEYFYKVLRRSHYQSRLSPIQYARILMRLNLLREYTGCDTKSEFMSNEEFDDKMKPINELNHQMDELKRKRHEMLRDMNQQRDQLLEGHLSWDQFLKVHEIDRE